MSNGQFQFLMRFLNRMADDDRLNTSHVSLCFALIVCWDQQRHKLPFKISRWKLMEYSKISSISTYHICINDLISFKLIKYAPSYNSFEGTLVTLLIRIDIWFFFRQERFWQKVMFKVHLLGNNYERSYMAIGLQLTPLNLEKVLPAVSRLPVAKPISGNHENLHKLIINL